MTSTWQSWNLKPGDQLSLLVEAADYRPGVGRTSLPRRVTILSDEEFDSRLAEKQTDLMQDLKRLLTDQRQTRKGSGELQLERDNQAQTARATLDRLATLGFEQLRINQGVTDPSRGATAQAEQLLGELERNRQDRPELSEQLRAVRDELSRLADDELPAAGRGLADAQRAAQQSLEQPSPAIEKQVDDSLASATGQQDRAIESLEGLVEKMADWSDHQRFAGELAEMEQRQRDLRADTLKEAARAAAAGKDSPERAATRAKLRAAQEEIARRFGKLQEAMRKSAGSGSQEDDSSTQALRDALAESQDRATRGKLDEAERQLRIGQLGRSAAEQQAGADDIREMLDILRDRASSDPGKLAEQLEGAQKKLAELQKELDKLKSQADQPQQEQPRKKLAEKTERLGRRLKRLDAQQAGKSSQAGAGKMQQAAEQEEQGREQLGEAQKDLKRAQEQLAEKIRQQKNLQALKVLDRLAKRMEGYIARQTEVLESTVRAEQETLGGVAAKELQPAVRQLADEQQALREEVEVARRNVAKREVFELALRGAVQQMDRAHERLDQQQVDRPTQQRQYSALQRLKHVSEALKINPGQPEEQQPKPPGQGGEGGGKPKPPSPIDVAELKMLRLMQLDLNARTRDLEAEAADQAQSPDAPTAPRSPGRKPGGCRASRIGWANWSAS